MTSNSSLRIAYAANRFSEAWRIGPHLLAMGLYLAFSLSVYRPISNERFYYGQMDNLLFFYIFEWERYALFAEPGRFFDGISFFPFSHSMFFTHLMLGALPIYAPIAAMAGPGQAMSVLVTLTPVLNGLAVYFAIRVLLKSWWPAVIAGFIVAFSPIQMNFSEFTNLSILWWFGLAVGIWFSALEKPAWWKVPAVALCVYLQFATTIYVGVFAALTIIALLFGGLAFGRLPWRGRRQLLISVGGAAVLALPFIPILWGYVGFFLEYADTRSLEEVKSLSAQLPRYLPWANYNQIWYVWFQENGILESFRRSALVGTGPFVIGVLGFALGIASKRLRPVTLALGLAALTFFLLSLGPELHWRGQPVDMPMLYTAFHSFVPGFAALRNATFFAIGAMVAVSILGGIGVHEVFSRFRFGDLGRTAGYVAVGGILALELAHVPVESAPIPDAPQLRDVLTSLPAVPTVFIPIGNEYDSPEDNMRRMWWSMTSSRAPLVNGYSGYEPRGYRFLENLADGADSGRRRQIVEALHALGVKSFVFDLKYLTAESVANWEESIRAVDGGARRWTVDRFHVINIKGISPPVLRSWADVDIQLVISSAVPGSSVAIPVLAQNRTNNVWLPPDGRAARRGYLEWRDENGRPVRKTNVVFHSPPVVISHGGAQSLAPLQADVPQRPGIYELSLVVENVAVAVGRVDVAGGISVLSDSRRAADLTVITPQVCVTSGESAVIQVQAVNQGNTPWHGEYRLGYKWMPRSNEFIPEDLDELEGRLFIPFDEEPSPWVEIPRGSGFIFEGWLQSPQTPGVYTVVIGMVEEGVEWFGDEALLVNVLPETAPSSDCENWMQRPA